MKQLKENYRTSLAQALYLALDTFWRIVIVVMLFGLTCIYTGKSCPDDPVTFGRFLLALSGFAWILAPVTREIFKNENN